MRYYETRDQVEAACYALTMSGTSCHIEDHDGSPVIMSDGVVIGAVARD